jgi:hypothetical protein
MELLRTTPLEFRSGAPLGRPSEAVSMNDVARILSAIEQGDPRAAGELLPLVYGELRRLAKQSLAREKPRQTLQATALVHEAYLRLVHGEAVRSWEGRGHFFAAAAKAMRRLLVDNARRKRAEKHGGRLERQDLDAIDIEAGRGMRLPAEQPTVADVRGRRRLGQGALMGSSQLSAAGHSRGHRPRRSESPW